MIARPSISGKRVIVEAASGPFRTRPEAASTVRRAACAATAIFLLLAAPLWAQDVSSEQVANAVSKGTANLKASVIRSAPILGKAANYHQVGVPLLGILALLNAGTPANDPAIAGLIDDVAEMDNYATYVVGLKCMVLAAAGPTKYAKPLQEAANWLAQAQLPNGMWTYTMTAGQAAGRGDNSNSQYALQGLHEAAKAGATVPKLVWERSRTLYENTQLQDGGWTYVWQPGMAGRPGMASQAYGSMTVAGLASLYICGARLDVSGPKQFIDGAYPSCGKYKQNEVIAKGLAWLAKNWSVKDNPPNRRGQWLNYYLYGMERVGMISGLRAIDKHDWYREGAAQLVATQNKDTGSWGQGYDTAFAVLFLAKGNRPVLVQKLQWQGSVNPANKNAMEWNRNIHDVENLLQFVGDKFGKPATWQTATLDLPMEALRQAPILYVTGHDFPAFNAADVAKLRQFVDTGGTLLFEACCGSKSYQAAFRKFAAQLYDPATYPLKPLGPSHPVFSSYFKLADPYDLEGIEVGCRVGVFFAPRALSCLWEMQDYKDSKTKWSEMAFQLGTNIAAYATGKEMLADRLDKVVLGETPKAATTQPLEIPRGAVRLARLVHDGDFDCDARALERLCYELRDKAKVAIVPAAKNLAPTDEKIFQYPVLFMTGHSEFKYSPEQVKALRTYLDRGGFLLAEACCGRQPFDKSFRELVKQLYPEGAPGAAAGARPGDTGASSSSGEGRKDSANAGIGAPALAFGAAATTSALTALSADHPIYAGRIGVPLGELRYRKALADELKTRGTTRPPLEAVTVDADGKPAATGRTTILYSPYDWSCALEGDKPFSCRGYLDEDGQRLALNLVLFAIGY